jgi:hypothetical protein
MRRQREPLLDQHPDPNANQERDAQQCEERPPVFLAQDTHQFFSRALGAANRVGRCRFEMGDRAARVFRRTPVRVS